MLPICPECQAGKHTNCNGIGGLDDNDILVACGCDEGDHYNRMYHEAAYPVQPQLFEYDGPPNDPGIEEAAFPELFDEDHPGVRLKPDVTVIRDLMDVQVLNPKGEWVPAVPLPIFLSFKRVQCHCKKKFWGRQRYQEHYAYAHILGMED